MKTFISFVVLLVACSVYAQEPSRTLINRIDRQTGEKTERIVHQVRSNPVPANTPEKTFAIVLSEPRLNLGLNDYGNITGVIKNLTSDTVRLIFKRKQNRETQMDFETGWGWSTSVCFGETCLPANTDSLSPEKAFKLPGDAETEFKLSITTRLQSDDSILVHMLIAAVGGSEGDTVGFWLSAVSQEPASVTTGIHPKRSSIRAVFPSPLISGTSINVRAECVRDVGYRYSIYDPFGREVAFGTSQRKLISGDNIFSISSLEGLGSGSYLLRLNFSDGSSDAYPFTVVR